VHVASVTASSIPAPVQQAPQHSSAPDPAHAPSSDAGQHSSLPAYVVRPHDNLWAIAKTHLGDASRWHEIADLNHNKPQPDGGRLTDPHWIRPGWRLLMPADATGLQPPSSRPQPPSLQHPSKNSHESAPQQPPSTPPA